jgi:hypothetical protein
MAFTRTNKNYLAKKLIPINHSCRVESVPYVLHQITGSRYINLLVYSLARGAPLLMPTFHNHLSSLVDGLSLSANRRPLPRPLPRPPRTPIRNPPLICTQRTYPTVNRLFEILCNPPFLTGGLGFGSSKGCFRGWIDYGGLRKVVFTPCSVCDRESKTLSSIFFSKDHAF